MAKILIVDDEKSIRITLKAFLLEKKYDVEIAENAEQAMAMLKDTFFEIIVTDIILPRITGVELLKSIKKISPQSRVIMMTGEPTVETAQASKRSGAFEYISKPIGKEKILSVVETALKTGHDP